MKTNIPFIRDANQSALSLFISPLLFALASLTLAAEPPATRPAPVPEAEIKRLVSVFGDADFRVRADATTQLINIGDQAAPFIREALKSTDPETRERAQATLDGIEEKKKIDAAIADGTFQRQKEAAELAEKSAIELKDMMREITEQRQQLTADMKEKRRTQIYETWPGQKNQMRDEYQEDVAKFKDDLEQRRDELGKQYSQKRQEGLAEMEKEYSRKVDLALQEHMNILDRQEKGLEEAIEPLDKKKVQIEQEFERRQNPENRAQGKD